MFIVLLCGSESMFLPPAWSSMNTPDRILGLMVVFFPYFFLYKAVYADPGYITPSNNADALMLYPYDWINFYPGNSCRTCHLAKPARSKHCSICKRCISRLDHHCIFINNCVGYGNYHWFLLLLLSTGILTTYGVYLGSRILSEIIRRRIPSWTPTGRGLTWSNYFTVLSWSLQEETRMGSITLLCLLISPLICGLFAYHIYLLWAGTTTNETMKWSEWKADISEGLAFRRDLDHDRQTGAKFDNARLAWPVKCTKIYIIADEPPPMEGEEGVGEWEQVWKLADVDNIYDVGLYRNLRDIFLPRRR